MRRAVLACVLTSVLGVTFAAPAAAELITFRLDGRVTSGQISAPGTALTFSPEEVSLWLTLDVGQPMFHASCCDNYSSHSTFASYSLATNGYTWSYSHHPTGHLYSDVDDDGGWWNVEIENQNAYVNGPSWGAAQFDYIYFTLGLPAGMQDYRGQLLPNIDTELARPAAFQVYFRGPTQPQFGSGYMTGEFTHIRSVPEPSSLFVVLVGLAGVAWRRRGSVGLSGWS